ncbi:MAG: HPr kinase/phosphatase C-terminal domain-containing protein [Alphaproteobacteria bacterium]
MPSLHASCVLVGPKAILIRGPSGSGKSRLALSLIDSAASRSGDLSFARLVGDDRVLVSVEHSSLIARPPPNIAGLIEIRGIGIRRMAFEAAAKIGLVVDLAASDAARLPEIEASDTEIEGIKLPRLQIPPNGDALFVTLMRLKPIAAMQQIA